MDADDQPDKSVGSWPTRRSLVPGLLFLSLLLRMFLNELVQLIGA
jgi:hypothetical protein